MRKISVLALFLLALVTWHPRDIGAAAAEGAAPALRRFALIVSSNDGGPGRVRLRFANSDARAMADVLGHLGGLRDQDLVLLPNASRASLQAAFERLRVVVAQAGGRGVRRELFVYYSGHSDEEGLLLGGERIFYRELRQWIEAAQAEVRIGVLDSCASGALIRLRGGSHRPPFLADVSTEARGHAFLTASSADEAAQESDRIGAAFFTHHLVSGLRGAADTSRDGRVTLGEAYQFAFAETLRRTERTSAGAQHPAYDIQLAGTGDLVLTDLRATNAGLVLDEKVAGRIYVRDAAGRLLVELRKEPLYPVELGLAPGRYRVFLDADGRPLETSVTLAEGKIVRLGQAGFSPVATHVATARGDSAPASVIATPASPHRSYRHVPYDLSLAPRLSLGAHADDRVLNNFVLGVVVGHSHALEGLQLSLAGNIVADEMHGVQVAVGFNLARNSARWLQLSIGANVVGGDFLGAQGSLVNLVRGELKGVQGGLVNGALGGMKGVQGGLVNVAGGQMHGLQGGLVNIGNRVTGPQIGLVNVANHVRGVQIGLVNIGRSVEGESIGLLNLIADGYHRLHVWSSDLVVSNVGLKLGSRHAYGILGFGLGRTDDDRALIAPQVGIGAHVVPFGGRLFVDADVLTSSGYAAPSNWKEDYGTFSSLRLVMGWQVLKHLAVTAGPTLNLFVHKANVLHRPGLGFAEYVLHDGGRDFRLFPGFVAGLQF